MSSRLFGEHGITRDDAEGRREFERRMEGRRQEPKETGDPMRRGWYLSEVQGSNRTNVILYVSVLICWEVLVNFRHAAQVTRRISGCDLPCHEPGQSAGGCFSG